MSSKSIVCDSVNKPKMLVKKSTLEARTRRHSVPSYIEVHESITMEIEE